MKARSALSYLGALFALSAGPVYAAIHPADSCERVSHRSGANLQSRCFATDYGGRQRTLYIYAPTRKQGPVPLVFVLHGGGGVGAGTGCMSLAFPTAD